MDRRARTEASRFLSYVLRHRPDAAGLALDDAGWAEVAPVLRGLAGAGHVLTRAELHEIVATSDKQRFALSEDGERIRAQQGHSVDVELGLPPRVPPAILYHGTAEGALPRIRAEGLRRGARHHVHLSPDPATAERVGRRHGRPVVLEIDAARMHADGFAFFRSGNGVWLTEAVPPQYLKA